MYISLLLVALLSVLVIGTDGKSSSIAAGQVYWNNVLPKTSMPKAIKDLLIQPAVAASTTKVLPMTYKYKWKEASTAKVLPTKEASTAKVLPTTYKYKWKEASTAKVLPTTYKYKWKEASTAKVLPTTYKYKWREASTAKVLPTTYKYKWREASTAKVLPTTYKYKWKEASTAKVLPTTYKYKWKEASTRKNKKIAGDENSSYDPTIIVYFFEKDLQAATKMTLSFPDTSVYGATFISKTQSNSIPFASSKLPDILSLFSINPTSPVASAMNETLTTCEDKPMKDEIKHCATSLESMVDFTISTLGTHNLLSISTTTDKENTPKQEYEVTSSKVYSGTKSGDNTVVCHAQTYAYAVFNCHKLRGVDVYGVEMVGADGSKVAAVATCHRDTSEWNPKNLALRILDVKPGTVPVCHFLQQYDVLWMANK